MTTVALREFRKDLPDYTARVQQAGERVLVRRNGKPAFAVVSVEDLRLLQKVEDLIDLEDARKARAEPGKNIPLAKVKVGHRSNVYR